MEDEEGQYNKLLIAYTQLKQKNAVLKKAVLENQERIQDTTLKEQLRMRDQQIRDLKQELDAISFQRDQLSRRVEVLQEHQKNSHKSKRDRNTQRNDAQSIQEEELQRKIAENAKLHTRVLDLEAALVKVKQDAQNIIASEKKAVSEAMKHLQARVDSLSNDLDSERVLASKFDSEMNTIKKQLEQAHQEADASNRAWQAQYIDLEVRYQHLQKQLYLQKPVFDCNAYPELHKFNFKYITMPQQQRLLKVQEDGKTIIEKFVSTMTAFIMQLERRTVVVATCFGDDDNEITQSFIGVMQQRCHFLNPLVDAFGEWCSSEDPTSFVDNFAAFSEFFVNLANQQVQFTKIETTSTSCTEALRTVGSDISKHFHQVSTIFTSIREKLINITSATSDIISQRVAYSLFLNLIGNLSDEGRSLLSCWRSMFALQQRLQDSSSEVSAVQNGLIDEAVKLSASFDRIVTFFRTHNATLSGQFLSCNGENVSPFVKFSQHHVQCKHQCLLQERTKAILQVTVPDVQLSSTSPSQENGDEATLGSCISSAQELSGNSCVSEEILTLKMQIADLKEKLDVTRHAKEQALLDVDLLRVKLKSPEQQNQNKQTSVSKQSVQNTVEPEDTSSKSYPDPQSCVSMLEETQRVIRERYDEQIYHLTEQLRYADAKAVAYFEECMALSQKLNDVKSSKQHQNQHALELQAHNEQEAAVATSRLREVQEDLAVTKKKYEDKLATMTETLLSMKDQLESKQAYIERLQQSHKQRRKR